MKEFVSKLREKADIFEKSGCSVDGIVKDYRKSADVIEKLCGESNIGGFVEKLIEKLDMEITDTYYKSVEGNGYAGIENNAYHNIKRFVMLLAEEYNQGPTKKNQGWIPCSERLPEHGKRYLVTAVWKDKDFETHSVYIFVYGSDGMWHFYNYEPVSHCEVIAWMPLPEAYKPEEKPQTNFYVERFNRVN